MGVGWTTEGTGAKVSRSVGVGEGVGVGVGVGTMVSCSGPTLAVLCPGPPETSAFDPHA